MPSFLFTTSDYGESDVKQAAADLITAFETALERQPGRYRLAASAEDADYIVFVEPPVHKFSDYEHALLSHPAVRDFSGKCYAYDWADGPLGFLPGVYPSLDRSRWDPGRQVSGGFLAPYNDVISQRAAEAPVWAQEPRFLLSFTGAPSHSVRRRLVGSPRLGEDPRLDLHVSSGWFDYSAESQTRYADGLLQAKFVLCPRGTGPATFRAYEAMALGRAPVIVSDQWLPPQGPDWGQFSLAIAEASVERVADIVAAREHDWKAMGRLARQAWESHFGPVSGLDRTLGLIEMIAHRAPRLETVESLTARWHSRAFRMAGGWHPSQRARRLISDPEVRRRVLRVSGRGG